MFSLAACAAQNLFPVVPAKVVDLAGHKRSPPDRPACLIDADHALKKIGSTGKAFFHTDIRVVNEAGKDAAAAPENDHVGATPANAPEGDSLSTGESCGDVACQSNSDC